MKKVFIYAPIALFLSLGSLHANLKSTSKSIDKTSEFYKVIGQRGKVIRTGGQEKRKKESFDSLYQNNQRLKTTLLRENRPHSGIKKDSEVDHPHSTIKKESKVDHPLWLGVKDILGTNTDRMKTTVTYPDYEFRIKNFLRPTPISNNLQIYPFTASIPMEGGDLLRTKEVEYAWTQTFITGKMEGSNSQYQLKMDHWFFEQVLSLAVGLPYNAQLSTSIPLYHFRGNSTFTQAGYEMVGLKGSSRNFWGAPSIGLKKLFYSHKEYQALVRLWFQFPEGNQRANGGSTSGHFGFNTILEKMNNDQRYQINFGLVEAGDLKLLNQQVLKQNQAYFVAFATTKKLAPTVAAEFQLHASKSALSYTAVKDFENWFVYTSVGVRKHYRGWNYSLSVLGGLQDMPTVGTTLDLRYRW